MSNTDENLVVSVTQSEIANDIGTAREVVGRKLNKLSLEGIISLKRGAVSVIDTKNLKQYAQL